MEWIDLQVNGYGGVSFNAPGLTPEMTLDVTRKLAAEGTAGFLPTLVTVDPAILIPNIRAVIAARKRYPECEKAIFTLLANCTGTTVEEIRNMDAVSFIDLLDQYVSREEFGDFFMRAWKLLSRSGNTNLQISSSADTLIRSL